MFYNLCNQYPNIKSENVESTLAIKQAQFITMHSWNPYQNKVKIFVEQFVNNIEATIFQVQQRSPL